MRKVTQLALLIALIVAGGFWWSHQSTKPTSANSSNKGKDRPAVVTLTKVSTQPFTSELTLAGTVTPISQVDIRPQLTGTIEAVHVAEGSMVKKGQLLFTLDNRAEATNRDKLAAQLAKDQATLADARRNLSRQQALVAQQFVSQSVLDTARSTVDAAAATVKADQAALAGSHVSLDYYRITAPADGRIGQINVHPGSLVQPGSTTALTTLTQLDPIHIAFSVPETRLTALHQAWQAAKETPSGLVVVAQTSPQHRQGKLVFIDTTVDSTAGSLTAKAEFDNRDQSLWPGTQVSVQLALGTSKQTTTIPAEAIQTGPDTTFVYVVGKDKKATAQPIKVIEIRDGLAAIEGVAPGTVIVKDGGQNVRPGGIVREAGKKPAEKTASGSKA